MKRKWLAVGIILLFVGTCTIPVIAQDTNKALPSSRGNWLYVGGSGPGNYTKIQDAIDNASDGDTIFVYDDLSPYYENLEIDKSIKLIGENKNTTIIDGGGNDNVVYVTDYCSVTICGFTIQHCGDDLWECAGIYLYDASGNTITDNIITNNSCPGIYCYNYFEYPWLGLNVISKNIVTKNRLGIVLDVSTYNEVYDNYVEDNQIGIFVGSSALPSESREQSLDEYYNNIYRNTILNNHVGIDIEPASFTNVFKNYIMNNDYGICIYAPYLTWCNYNSIYQNNIHNNTYGIHLIAIVHTMCNYNCIYQNNIHGNTYGIKADAEGGYIVNNNISENNFYSNTEGISLEGGSIEHNNISKNNFISNTEGISLCSDSIFRPITLNTISNNNFIGNNNSAYFEYLLIARGHNQWVSNYWEKPRLLPYLILGKLKILRFTILSIDFDWHPAQEPYDIPGMR